MMDADSIDIAINTNGNIKINLEANNLGYELNKNILTIKKINIAEGADYSGVLTITANKDTDLENIYREKSITIYINSNTLYTDLSVNNDVLNIEPNTNIDLAVNTNADTIEYYIDNTNYEITKNDKTLNIKNISESEKTGAILTITASALSAENTTYVSSTIQVYINRTKAEVKELLTLDIVSSIEASNNSILKRDDKGQAFGKNIELLSDDLLINHKTLENKIKEINEDIDTEIDNRQNADTLLQNNIDSLLTQLEEAKAIINKLVSFHQTDLSLSKYETSLTLNINEEITVNTDADNFEIESNNTDKISIEKKTNSFIITPLLVSQEPIKVIVKATANKCFETVKELIITSIIENKVP